MVSKGAGAKLNIKRNIRKFIKILETIK